MFCQKCGAELGIDDGVCKNCGALRPGKKFCQHCAQVIDEDCVICPKCGKQVSQLKQEQPQVIINNANNNANTSTNANMNTNISWGGGAMYGRLRNKWAAFFLCLFLGFFGAHKFYEGKIGMGIVYLFTLGLFGFGWFIDLIILLFKPNPYFV